MFLRRYFPRSVFLARYFPQGGGTPVPPVSVTYDINILKMLTELTTLKVPPELTIQKPTWVTLLNFEQPSAILTVKSGL